MEKGRDTLCPYYHDDLKYIMGKMHRMLYADCRQDKEYIRQYNHIIRKYSVMSARVNFAPFLAGFITCTAYNLKPLVLAWIYWSKGKDIVWVTPFNMT